MTTQAAQISPVQRYLEDLLEELREDRSGAVADYIPELAAADPELFGIALATVDGAVYATGDHDTRFSIQSMSKPFTYALALASCGTATVDAHIGVEPTGDAFNSISLEPSTGRPRNPMINAGAITATALVPGDRDAAILDLYSRCAGRQLDVDVRTFESERETGHRNRAIGHMLRAVEILDVDPEPVLEAYFRQCAVAVDCRDVALMAATLANGGLHPQTGESVISPEHVRRVLSVMTTCGMYDGAGNWLVGVGLPAKSGVAGGVMAVLPGQLGICVFSPRLDEVGNSVRGVAACERMSAELGLHSLDVARATRSTIRTRYDLTQVQSTRRRPAEERQRLAEGGDRCTVFELQGDLVFGALERVTREVTEISERADVVVLDLGRVSHLGAAARRGLGELASALDSSGVELVIAADTAAVRSTGLRVFRHVDDAIEWAEWTLLGLDRRVHRPPVTLDTHPLTSRLSGEHRERLAQKCQLRPFSAGEVLVRAGDPATELLFLMSGEVSVSVGGQRLSTLLPGALFGETALRHPAAKRSADVVAERDGELLVLSAAAFEGLAETDLALQAGLLRALLETSNEIVDRLTRRVSALS